LLSYNAYSKSGSVLNWWSYELLKNQKFTRKSTAFLILSALNTKNLFYLINHN